VSARLLLVELVDADGVVLATAYAHLLVGAGPEDGDAPWSAEIILPSPYQQRTWSTGPLTLRLADAPHRAGWGLITFPGTAIVLMVGAPDSPPFWQ
jgi:hypothetical protein